MHTIDRSNKNTEALKLRPCEVRRLRKRHSDYSKFPSTPRFSHVAFEPTQSPLVANSTTTRPRRSGARTPKAPQRERAQCLPRVAYY